MSGPNSLDTVAGGVAAGVLLVLGLAMFCVYVYSIFWAYADAEQRGKPGCLVALLVMFFSWPIGLIMWIVFRPEPRWRP